jgi:hypothetical protein
LTDSCAKQFSLEQRRCSPARVAPACSPLPPSRFAPTTRSARRGCGSRLAVQYRRGLALAFNRDEVSALLVEVHPALLHLPPFCGVKIETDYILPASEGAPMKLTMRFPSVSSATRRFIATTQPATPTWPEVPPEGTAWP